MFKEKKDYLILALFLFLLLVLILANLSQTKDTAKFISLEAPEEESIGEEKSKGEVAKEMMSTTLPSVAPGGDLLTLDYATAETYVYSHNGVLEDITAGKNLFGLLTEGNAKGQVQTLLKDNSFHLLAKFQDLPTPPQGHYYEGWVVRLEPFRYESTGKLEQTGENFINVFGSTKDLLEHDFYVVTLEPDDNDPTPSLHVLEGEISPN